MASRDTVGEPNPGWRKSLRSIEAAAIAGVVAAVGWVYALNRLLEGPDIDATEDEIARYYADVGTGWDTLIVLQVLVFGTIGFLWFVGVVRNRVGPDAPRLFDTVFFGGGILFAGLLFVGAAALAAPFLLSEIGGAEVSAGAAAMVRSFALVVLAVFTPRIGALFVFSSSTLGLRSGVLPRWLAYVGYAVGGALLINVTFFSPSVYVLPGWIAIVSIELLLNRGRRSASAGS